jgi:hypothetical protein
MERSFGLERGLRDEIRDPSPGSHESEEESDHHLPAPSQIIVRATHRKESRYALVLQPAFCPQHQGSVFQGPHPPPLHSIVTLRIRGGYALW